MDGPHKSCPVVLSTVKNKLHLHPRMVTKPTGPGNGSPDCEGEADVICTNTWGQEAAEDQEQASLPETADLDLYQRKCSVL